MKTSITLTLAALMLATVPAPSYACQVKKKPVQTQAATASQQVSIKHVRLRARVLVVNQ